MKQVSDRRQEKRDRLGQRGELCDAAKRVSCFECRKGPTDPAHLDRVGMGFGDFARIGRRWRGRVAPACRPHHRVMDRNVVGWSDELERQRGKLVKRAATAARIFAEKWAREHGLDLGARAHPYEQLRARGGRAGDILD